MHEESRVSMFCWVGKHKRCTGWMVVPDETNYGRKTHLDQSIACECPVCFHPPIDRYRHLHERWTKGATWSSSTTTPS